MNADRFDDAPMTFDPEHPDLGWTISEPLPYYDDDRSRLAAFLRRWLLRLKVIRGER